MRQIQPWYVGCALRALGCNVLTTARTFTAGDLVAWSQEFAPTPGMAKTALQRLCNHEMAEPLREFCGATGIERWHLTTKGLATCRAAAQAQPGAAPDPNALSTKLWNLLRGRRILTAQEAVEVLADAGDGKAARMHRSITEYLRVWAIVAPDVVKVSAKRATDRKRCKRYAIDAKAGIYPPPVKVDAVRPVAAPRAHAAPSRTPRGQA